MVSQSLDQYKRKKRGLLRLVLTGKLRNYFFMKLSIKQLNVYDEKTINQLLAILSKVPTLLQFKLMDITPLCINFFTEIYPCLPQN